MRVYVHHAGEPEFTHLVKVEDTGGHTVSDAAASFAAAFNAAHPARALAPGSVRLSRGRGSPCRGLGPAVPIADAFHDRDDVFAKGAPWGGVAEPIHAPAPVAPAPAPPRPAALQPPAKKPPPKRADATAVNLPASVGMDKPVDATVEADAKAALESILQMPESQVAPMITQMLNGANTSLHSRNFRSAMQVYLQILEIIPAQKSCLRGLGTICLEIKKHKDAAYWLRRGIEAYPEDPAFRYQMSQALSGMEMPMEALVQLESALKQFKGAGSASDGLDEPMIQVARARALLALGQENVAGAVIMAVLKEDEQRPEALLEYARIVLSRGLVADCVQVLLRLLVKGGGAEAKDMLADAVQREGGLEALLHEMQGATDSAPALAFVATTVKDFGAIDAAAELYRRAVRMEPQSASYSLNLVHTLEVARRYDEAVAVIREYCERNGDTTLGGGLTLGSLVPLLSGLPKLAPKYVTPVPLK